MTLSSLTVDAGSAGTQTDRDTVRIEQVTPLSISVDTKGTGDDQDTVLLTGAMATGLLSISTGNVHDTVEISGGRYGAGAIETEGVPGGRDVDTVTIRDANIETGELRISTGRDLDIIEIEDAEIGDLFINTDSMIDTRDSGGDRVFINGLSSSRYVQILTGGGDSQNNEDFIDVDNMDVGETLIISTGDDFDQVYMDGVTTKGNVFLDKASGGSLVELESIVVGKLLNVRTGDGRDTVRLTNTDVRTGLVDVRTGDELDTLFTDRVFSNWLNLEMGYGDDVVDANRIVASYGGVWGGTGFHRLRANRLVFAKQGKATGFEA